MSLDEAVDDLRRLFRIRTAGSIYQYTIFCKLRRRRFEQAELQIGQFLDRLRRQAVNGLRAARDDAHVAARHVEQYPIEGGSLPLASAARGIRYPLCGGHPRNAPVLPHGCASRVSGVLNNYHSCKRHEVAYSELLTQFQE